MSHIVLNGDNLDVLKKYPDNYFDAVVTDPPYGLGKEPDAAELMKSWVETGYHEVKGSGFMGKEWDAFVPQPIFWKEVFRVLKHGGHVLAFYGTRTYDWGVMGMRFAGFEVRDTIYWHYGSGFPKSHNISKAVDKLNGTYVEGQESPNSRRGIDGDKGGYDHSKKITLSNPQSEKAKLWDGWGTALKPASEPIVMARKPLEKGLSIAENVLKYGTGAINIDGCRVGFKDEADYKESTQKNQHGDFGTQPMTNNTTYGDWSMIQPKNYQPTGRFPANLIMTHHPECECKGFKKVKSFNFNRKYDDFEGKEIDNTIYSKGYKREKPKIEHDENGDETVEDWNCHPDCPIRVMDEQSGITKSSDAIRKNNRPIANAFGKYNPDETKGHSDSGGASRFFYCAKASKSERNKGLEGFEDKLKMTQMRSANGSGEKNFDGGFQDQIMKNIHPTVKPVKLMQYLVRLVTPPNGVVLDPFCGSGTTGIACKLEGFQFVGIEQDPEYTKIAEARIKNYVDEQDEIKPKEKTENKEISQGSLF